jgi:signal transduction histidine kinase
LTQKRELLVNVRDQLEVINWDPDEQGLMIGITDTTELLEEELLALREKTEEDMELSQLGMAIEVINHEFESSIKSIRSNLRRLKEWANMNEGLLEIYENLRTSFDHLDGYLTLFTPLHRRLYRKPIEMSGSDINQFLEDLFRERLARDKIQLKASNEFLNFKIIGYPSTFYPVFINLIDNALFWIQDSNEPRIVMLNVNGDSLLVSDTGPGISLRDRGSIFDQGFTKKIGGRGLGLYISRDILTKVGYSLTLDDTNLGSGATFRIKPSES